MILILTLVDVVDLCWWLIVGRVPLFLLDVL